MCGARSRRLPIRDACMSGRGRGGARGGRGRTETGDNVKSNVLYVMSFRKTRLRKRRAARFRDRTTTDDDHLLPSAPPPVAAPKCDLPSAQIREVVECLAEPATRPGVALVGPSLLR